MTEIARNIVRHTGPDQFDRRLLAAEAIATNNIPVARLKPIGNVLKIPLSEGKLLFGTAAINANMTQLVLIVNKAICRPKSVPKPPNKTSISRLGEIIATNKMQQIVLIKASVRC